MKLLILLSVLALSYGDKLDRTYLPPANAISAGGSPGALTAPGLSGFGTTGPSGQLFGQQSNGLSSRPNTFVQANQQTLGQGGSPSFNSDSNRPLGFSSEVGVKKPSKVYGPADSRPIQGNNSFNSGFVPTGSQSVNQPLEVSDTRDEFGQQPSSNSFGSNAYSQTNGQNFVGASSQPESERPQAAADRNAEILKYVNNNDGDRFTYSFETSNGISAEETGVASGGVKAQGGYSYTGDDGKSYTITYTADEQGYQPQGEHLPTPHPIPEEILKSIEKNAQAAAAGTQEGAYRPEDYESEDNSQGYSGPTAVSKSQGQNEFSAQQYNPPIDRPSSQINFQQTKPERQNIPISQTTYSDRVTNVPSSSESVKSTNNNLGSINQAESQRRSGYQYSRPQTTQYSSLPGLSNQAFGTQPSQSPSQFVSQIPFGFPFSTSVNGASGPDSQNQRGQVFSKPSQVSKYQQSDFKPISNNPSQGPQSAQNYNQEPSGSRYQPGTTNVGKTAPPTFPKQIGFQNQGATSQPENQYQLSKVQANKPSLNQRYQSQNVQSTSSSQNGFNGPKGAQQNPTLVTSNSNLASGFPNSITKESAPIQAPYQYRQPSQPFKQNQAPQNSFKQPASNQGQVSASNKPAIGSPQTTYTQPIQSPFQSTFNQNVGQVGQNKPSQIQSSFPSFNRPSQNQASVPGFQSANRPEQFSGPRQPPSYNPEEGYKY